MWVLLGGRVYAQCQWACCWQHSPKEAWMVEGRGSGADCLRASITPNSMFPILWLESVSESKQHSHFNVTHTLLGECLRASSTPTSMFPMLCLESVPESKQHSHFNVTHTLLGGCAWEQAALPLQCFPCSAWRVCLRVSSTPTSMLPILCMKDVSESKQHSHFNVTHTLLGECAWEQAALPPQCYPCSSWRVCWQCGRSILCQPWSTSSIVLLHVAEHQWCTFPVSCANINDLNGMRAFMACPCYTCRVYQCCACAHIMHPTC